MSLDRNMIWNLAEAHLSGTLSGEDAAYVREMSAKDPAFAAELQECINMLSSVKNSMEHRAFRSMLSDIAQKPETSKAITKQQHTIPLRTHYLRTAAIAAGIAILTSVSTIWAIRYSNSRIESQYSLLKRDLEKYKRSQNQLINNINGQKKPIPAQAKYGGTGFALTNDGYIVTNYHVVEEADSVYIQNNKGEYYKAHTLSFDKKADIAILEVEDKDFRFGKGGDVPYSFATGKSLLGTKIYSLGFPQDEIVYSEGYISSKNGYEGDSLQYRLEIPAGPGQSGAPVLDANGNVVGIITGKQSESEGITYAVGSEALTHLIDMLPKRKAVKLSKSNRLSKLSREQQIAKLENYTCSIKVYK